MTIVTPAPGRPGATTSGRRRRPTGAPPPLPRQIGASGRVFIAGALIMTVWVVLFAVTGWASELTEQADAAVLRAFARIRTEWAVTAARGIDRMATGWTMSAIAFALLVATLVFRRWRHLFAFLGTVLVLEAGRRDPDRAAPPAPPVRRDRRRALARLLDAVGDRGHRHPRRGRGPVDARGARAAALDRRRHRRRRRRSRRRQPPTARHRPPLRHPRRPGVRRRRPADGVPLVHAEQRRAGPLQPGQDSPPRRHRTAWRGDPPRRRGAARGRHRRGQAVRARRLGRLDAAAADHGRRPPALREGVRDEPRALRPLVQARTHRALRPAGGRGAVQVGAPARPAGGLHAAADARRRHPDGRADRDRRADARARVHARDVVPRRCDGARRRRRSTTRSSTRACRSSGGCGTPASPTATSSRPTCSCTTATLPSSTSPSRRSARRRGARPSTSPT